jgi:hypothetical protein
MAKEFYDVLGLTPDATAEDGTPMQYAVLELHE